jgi:hypothetical protein
MLIRGIRTASRGEGQTIVMDRAVIEAMTDSALSGDLGVIHDKFAANGLEEPVVRWGPTVDALTIPELAFLRRFWDEVSDPSSSFPDPRAIDPFVLKPALGNIMLLDVLEDGWDYQYRLYGSKIAEFAKRDYTGQRTSQLLAGPWITMFYIAMYRAVLRRPVPLYTENAPPADVPTTRWHRLIFPFGVGDRITRLLVGNVPGPWRKA